MSTLKENLEEIKRQKDTYIKPENLKKDITVFGVTGNYSGTTNVKHFNSVEEMNSSTNNNDKDLAIVCNLQFVDISADNQPIVANALYLPETLPSGANFALTANTTIDGYYVEITSPTNGMIRNDMGGNVFGLYGKNEDGSYTRGNGSYDKSNPIFSLENIYMYDGDYSITNLTVVNPDDIGWNYVKLLYITDMVVYQYDNLKSKWVVLPNNYHIEANEIIKDKSALSRIGPIVGTLDLVSEKSFMELPAFSATICKTFATNTNVIPDISVNLNTTTKPTGFGDKRYFFSAMPDEMHGANHWRLFAGYWDDPDKKLYIKEDGQLWDGSAYYMPCKAFTFSESVDLEYDNRGPIALSKAVSDMLNSVSITELSQNDSTVGYWNYDKGYICTNCEIINETNDDIIVPAGPKASNVLVGSYYINIFGEQVAGTKEIGS